VDDQRSVQRIAGFRAHAEIAVLVSANSWFVEEARKQAATLLAGNPAGIFACNDRLAEAVIDHARELGASLPPLIGFDNAPVAERLRLTTIGIPWDSFVSHAVEIIKTRLGGGSGTAKLVSISHEPILRLTSRS
jgi:DNA-binding LacI/PurR family transcriptional regulator